MSYDFAVFDPTDAPATEDEFLVWFEHETGWEDERDYHDPAGTTTPSPMRILAERSIIQKKFAAITQTAI